MANYTSDTDRIWVDSVSSDTLGLFVDTLNIPPMATQRYNSWTTRADEDSFSADDTYNDISYSVELIKFYPTALDDQYIHNYFRNPEKLQLSCKPNVFYKVTSFNLEQPENLLGKRYRYRANFTLSPFAYSVDDELTEYSNGDAVTYIGTRYGKPLIAIKGGGAESTVRISINGYSIQITDVQAGEVLYIDSEQKLVRDNNGQMIYNRVSGRYPILDFGSSTISWTGELEYVKLIKNERWL